MLTYTFKPYTINLKLLPEVYEPAEDSFMMVKVALSSDATLTPEDKVLEIGTGSGIISAFLKEKGCKVIATDISPYSVKCAKYNNIEVIRCDLFSGISKKAKFDVIIFNPPYLLTAEEEKIKGWINYAFDGGADGRKVINRFLNEVHNYLTENGRVLILVSDLTGIDYVWKKMESLGFYCEEMHRCKYFFEMLVVIKGVRGKVRC